MEREVGGGIGMGSTCKPMADSFQCKTNPLQLKKKKYNSCYMHLVLAWTAITKHYIPDGLKSKYLFLRVLEFQISKIKMPVGLVL